MLNKNQMSLQDHLKELRNRVIFCVVFFVIAFFICYFFSERIYEFLLEPFVKISQNNQGRRLIYTNPTEAFMTYLKLSFSSALFFSFPVFATQIYLFLSPALYKNEKKNVLLIFFFTPFLFLCGAIFSYYFILPSTFKFFSSFESKGLTSSSLPIQLETKISEYLNFVTELLIGFGIAFELPILLLFLVRVGFLSIDDLKKRRRYWIVIIFIISAILTPPDVLSQISLAIPMVLLFEITLLIGKNFSKKK
jgi:sec-independent protein translocase protein TatC